MAGAWGLGRLLRALAEIPGLLRLRYTTSHPRDMDDDLIAAHARPAAADALPAPAGAVAAPTGCSTAMNRGHTRGRLPARGRPAARRPARHRALRPTSSSGFPGETEADFEATLALVRRGRLRPGLQFKYSPRPGTPAAGAPAQVPEAVKDARLQALQALLRDQQDAFNRSRVGMTLPVLFTGPAAMPASSPAVRPWLQPVHVSGPLALVGTEAP